MMMIVIVNLICNEAHKSGCLLLVHLMVAPIPIGMIVGEKEILSGLCLRSWDSLIDLEGHHLRFYHINGGSFRDSPLRIV